MKRDSLRNRGAEEGVRIRRSDGFDGNEKEESRKHDFEEEKAERFSFKVAVGAIMVVVVVVVVTCL